MDARIAPCPTFFLTRMLSKSDKTALSVEETSTGGLLRVRVQNADLETSLLLTREEAEWLRDTLTTGIGSIPHDRANGS